MYNTASRDDHAPCQLLYDCLGTKTHAALALEVVEVCCQGHHKSLALASKGGLQMTIDWVREPEDDRRPLRRYHFRAATSFIPDVEIPTSGLMPSSRASSIAFPASFRARYLLAFDTSRCVCEVY